MLTVDTVGLCAPSTAILPAQLGRRVTAVSPPPPGLAALRAFLLWRPKVQVKECAEDFSDVIFHAFDAVWLCLVSFIVPMSL
jgi:hypothetical protein